MKMRLGKKIKKYEIGRAMKKRKQERKWKILCYKRKGEKDKMMKKKCKLKNKMKTAMKKERK